MLQERRLEGEWWTLGSPEPKSPGVLTFRADRFELEVEGTLVDRPEPGPGTTVVRSETVEVEVIHGETTDGQLVTLLESRADLPSHDLGWFTSQHWWPRLMVLGGHIDHETLYDRLILQTDHLTEWAGTPRIHRDIEHDGVTATAVTVQVARRVLEESPVPGLGHVQVVAHPKYEVRTYDAEVGVETALTLQSESCASLETMMQRAEWLRSFLRLCIGAPTAITELRLRPAGTSTNLEVLFRSVAFGGKRPKPQSWAHMFAARFDLPNGFGAALARWLTVVERHDQAWFRLCATDFLQLTNTDEAFVAYCQALEALHSGDFDAPTLAVEERDERITRALAALPDDLVGWATPLLEGSTSPVFRHRIAELVRATGPVGELFTGGEVQQFAARTTATRNPLTHPRTRRTANFISDQGDRYEHGRALHFVGIAYLLHLVGVPLADVAERYARNSAVHVTIDRLASKRTPATARG